MKKIYLLAAAFGFALSGIAQYALPMTKKSITNAKPVESVGTMPKALGDTLWTDGFENPSDWVIENDGVTAPAAGWTVDANLDSWYFANAIASTSGGNYAEVGNGTDPNAVAAQGVTYTLTTANPIDIVALGGGQFVNLEFKQYGAFFQDEQSFQISEDGVNFETVGTNLGRESLTNTGGAAYDNPELVRINLGQYLSANPTQVWIRFLWTSEFPASVNNNAWITYGWMVDDVQITTLADNDIATNSLNYGSAGLYYFQIPENQIAPIEMSVIAENNGSNPQEGVTFQATESLGSGYVGTSPVINSAIQGRDSLVISSPFTPSGQGNYNIDFEILNDSIDDDPANNSMESYSFAVGENIYARDNGTPTGSFTGNNLSPAVTIEPANFFDIWADDELYAINATMGATLGTGIEVYGTVYEVVAGDFVFVAETELYTTTASDASSEILLPFAQPLPLNANTTYLVSVSSFDTEFSVATAGFSPDQTSFIQGDLGTGGFAWYFFNSTFMVRMNFDESIPLSTENNELSNLQVNQFPNPFANETTVSYTLPDAASVNYSVVDMTGKVIATGNEGTQSAGKHSFTIDGSAFSNGMYFLELNAGENKVTRRLVVNK
jgi:hypothetical protein